MNTYFIPILQQVTTTSDAETLTAQIDHALENLYQITNISMNELIDQNLSKEIGIEIKKSFHDHGMSWEHHEEVKSFFLGLKQELAKCKVITLTLAYHPTEQHIKRLKEWCIKNIDDCIIFEIEHDTSIIGGAVIVMNGHYLDLSVKGKLDNYFESKGKIQNENVKIAMQR